MQNCPLYTQDICLQVLKLHISVSDNKNTVNWTPKLRSLIIWLRSYHRMRSLWPIIYIKCIADGQFLAEQFNLNSYFILTGLLACIMANMIPTVGGSGTLYEAYSAF